MWTNISEKVVSNLRLPVVLSGHSGFLHHLKLIFPIPLFSHSIAPFLYKQTLSMHDKPNEIGVKPTMLKSGVWEFQDNWKNGLTRDQK